MVEKRNSWKYYLVGFITYPSFKIIYKPICRCICKRPSSYDCARLEIISKTVVCEGRCIAWSWNHCWATCLATSDHCCFFCRHQYIDMERLCIYPCHESCSVGESNRNK